MLPFGRWPEGGEQKRPKRGSVTGELPIGGRTRDVTFEVRAGSKSAGGAKSLWEGRA
jgi:polyisoprenoid-binding protein YceI